MRHTLNFFIYRKFRNVLFQETRRYSGHSKWQNIKAIKQEKDAARSQLFGKMITSMKAAIAETGNSDPNFNPKLANLIDNARKANMPASTLKSALEKLQKNCENTKNHIMVIRSPTGVIFIVHVAIDNPLPLKLHVNHILKKFKCKLCEQIDLYNFDCASYIIAFKDCNYDEAMENAIETDAQDVEEINEDGNTYFKFKAEFLFPDKTTNQLKSLGYTIISVENKCIPTSMIEVNEETLSSLNKLKQKLYSDIKEIQKIEDNIAST